MKEKCAVIVAYISQVVSFPAKTDQFWHMDRSFIAKP